MPLTVYDLTEKAKAYRRGAVSLDDFEDWFRASSRGSYSDGPGISSACASVEAAFSKLYFEGIDEDSFKEELLKAVGLQSLPT